MLVEQHKVLFVSGRRSLKNPRDENYWDMLVFGLCPNFKFWSLTFLIILADIAVFIFQLSKGLDKEGALLEVKTQTIIDYGGNYYTAVKNGEVYRFLSAIFLHVSFIHIFGNVIVTFFFLSRIEYTFGIAKTLVIYLLSGITANIFRDAITKSDVPSAGASTSLYGVIGVIVGYIVLNWNGLDMLGPVIKCQVFCSAFMIIIFIFIFTPTSGSNIDFYGHLGGFLSGLWLSAIHNTIATGKCETVTRVIFLIFFFIQLLTCLLVLYLD